MDSGLARPGRLVKKPRSAAHPPLSAGVLCYERLRWTRNMSLEDANRGVVHTPLRISQRSGEAVEKSTKHLKVDLPKK